ncbi:unnamed protein product [Brachionus calyciflorus]|uniref:Uncharacterized protein n=1 Tax=Brachionus calyciflorus TaxID=104777 RepID=A0A814QLZ0_9BILA|nr:unnamed protein product [Brachionus calyciflorus]
MPDFDLVWFFLEALNPRVRAELESKNVDTLKDAIRVNFVEEFKDGDKCKMEFVYTCNSSDLLCVSGFVNGHSIKFALDSGCTTSINRSKFVKKYGLNLNDSRIKIKTANNSISKVDGKTDSLKVVIISHVCDLEFLVIDHEDNDGLLWLDWFMRTGASLHPSIKSLKFPSEIVLLDTLEMENCNKVFTEILSDEVFPIDTAEDFDIAEEDWPLESGLRKIEIQPIDREFYKLSFSNNKSLFINDNLYEPKINITRRVRYNSRYKKKAPVIKKKFINNINDFLVKTLL